MWQTRQHAATAWAALNIADINWWPWFLFPFQRPTFPHTEEQHSQQAGRQDTGGGQQSNSRRQVEVVASLSELQVANNGTKPGSRYLHQTQTIHAHCTHLETVITSNIRKRFIMEAQIFWWPTNKPKHANSYSKSSRMILDKTKLTVTLNDKKSQNQFLQHIKPF